jgi:large subunit ribosomal protein L7Ae
MIQRQRKVLSQRLKVPPTINQFKNILNKNEAAEVFRLLAKYAPETAAEKKARLADKAKAEAEGKPAEEKKARYTVKFGLDNVTKQIEKKQAKLVLIADDVDPLELVMWLPALCHKMGVAYAIVSGKAKLGALVHQKNATCVCLNGVEPQDEAALNSLKESFSTKYAETKKWGGGIMGLKTQRKLSVRAAAIAAEKSKKAKM